MKHKTLFFLYLSKAVSLSVSLPALVIANKGQAGPLFYE